MSRLHFELPCGAAGDMLLGALIDCGADEKYIIDTLTKLNIEDWSLELTDVVRSGITAKKVVIIDKSDGAGGVGLEPSHSHGHEHTHSHSGEHSHGHEHTHSHSGEHSHGHEHTHSHSGEHSHGHEHTHSHSGEHSHGHSAHRHLGDMLKVLDNPVLSKSVQQKAAAIFNLIAEVEGEVHGLAKEKVHFHEVSGVDTLLDVIGTLLALENMGVEHITASEVAVGSGTVKCAHGIMPVPAPATMKIIQKRAIPIYAGSVESELLTPTGAAILGVLCEEFGKFSGGRVVSVGYGAGDKDFPKVANAVRAVCYTRDTSTAIVNDRIIEIRFAVDDITGEELGLLQENLYGVGVLESYALPAIMKKSRGGYEVVVLLRIADRPRVEQVIFSSGVTLGIRLREVGRSILERVVEEVKIEGHSVKVKLGMYKGKIVSAKAEFDDCKRVAEVTGKEVSEVRRLVWRLFNS